jgi:hypothetical protein
VFQLVVTNSLGVSSAADSVTTRTEGFQLMALT